MTGFILILFLAFISTIPTSIFFVTDKKMAKKISRLLEGMRLKNGAVIVSVMPYYWHHDVLWTPQHIPVVVDVYRGGHLLKKRLEEVVKLLKKIDDKEKTIAICHAYGYELK